MAALCALALAGCAVVPRYPSAFPALLAEDEHLGHAPDLSGRYVDRGEGYAPSSRPVAPASLTALLHGGAGEASAEAVAVSVEGDGTLELRSLRGGDAVAVTRRRFGEPSEGGTPANYLGVHGFVVIGLGTEHAGAGGVGGAAGDESLWLRKAEDGSLIVLHRVLFVGLLVIAPFAGRVDTWYRFPPAP
jgi:hypothetical protein